MKILCHQSKAKEYGGGTGRRSFGEYHHTKQCTFCTHRDTTCHCSNGPGEYDSRNDHGMNGTTVDMLSCDLVHGQCEWPSLFRLGSVHVSDLMGGLGISTWCGGCIWCRENCIWGIQKEKPAMLIEEHWIN